MGTRLVAALASVSTTVLLVAGTSVVAVPASSAAPGQAAAPASLPLGPEGLPEVRTKITLQRGVTLTTIVRGEVDPRHFWTLQLNVPALTSPDPDAPPTALSDRTSAETLADRLRRAGFEPRVEEVTAPATADYLGGRLGFRVRVGRLLDQPAATALLAVLVRQGFTAAIRFTGWDGSTTDRGPWRLQVLTLDPRTFDGHLLASFGPDIEHRETTSSLSRAVGATAAVNAGYFVLDPKAGAPGDPAGLGVYGGRVRSESVGRRPALVLSSDARRTRVQRLRWRGSVLAGDSRLSLDGINRVPGLIRNCGGTRDDQPTAAPVHDFTCTDASELVAFTPQFGMATPAGPGLEAVMDRHQRVVSLRSPRGGPLMAHHRSVQATGSRVAALRRVASLGSRLRISASLSDQRGRPVRTPRTTSIVNGGPELVRAGRVHVTPQADGFVRPRDPSFYYGFSASRNPRTFAGVDRSGRTVLVTADGRSTASLGLSITETAAAAKALGLQAALNLDGGGSTTMVARGRVTNQPSDVTGERPVGDALLVLPRRGTEALPR